MSPFHKFLLKYRPYCERCNIITFTKSTQVIRENGHNVAVCDIHAEPFKPIETGLRNRGRLEAR